MATFISVVILVLFVAVAARHLQRTFFLPRPPALPDGVTGEIAAALARFEGALREYAPETLSALQPGLSDEAIRALERQYHFRLTDEMRALYRWRNGTPAEAMIELIPGHRFVPLEEAAMVRREVRRQATAAPLIQRLAYAVFTGHRTNWLVVLDDRAGDGYFYDSARRKSPGHFFHHFAEDARYRFFPSLATFLVGAAECYERNIYRVSQSGQTRESYERSHDLWDRYTSVGGES